MLKLAENGSTRYSIQIAPDANLVTVHAAEELSRFLEEITGARFNILTADERPEGPVIAVGRPDAARGAGIDLAALGEEGYALKTAGEDGAILGSVDRDRTWRIQTPQVFKADLIQGALTKAMKQGLPLTDDSSAMEILGVTTYLVEGDEENIKLTKPLDLLLAAAILRDRRERNENRTGV